MNICFGIALQTLHDIVNATMCDVVHEGASGVTFERFANICAVGLKLLRKRSKTKFRTTPLAIALEQ